MRIEELQAFLAVAQTGSFQEAAIKCGVTQSTISRQVQNLEEDCGMPLLHRGVRSHLTIAGEKLLPKAKRMVTDWEEALTGIAAMKEGEQTELCVAAIHSVCAHYLPPVLQQFYQLYPEIQLRVTSLGSDRSLKVLRDGLVDLAIVMNNPNLTSQPGIVVDKLYDEPIQILMAADHPLTQFEIVPWPDLGQFPQVVFKDGYGMQRLVHEQFRKLNLELKATIELNTLDAFRGVIRQGQMIALLPKGALAECQMDSTLAVRDLPPLAEVNGIGNRMTRAVVMVTTSDRLLVPPIANFRRLVHELLRTPADMLSFPLIPTAECA